MSSPSSSRADQSLLTLLKNIVLVVISILLLPASLFALSYNYAALVLCPQNRLRHHVRLSPRFKPRKVVITGISTPAGLRVARALYQTGHDVVGIEDRSLRIPKYARWSTAVSRLYMVPVANGKDATSRYAAKLFQVIVRERASLWIDCSAGDFLQAKAQAKAFMEERSTCACLVPNVEQFDQFAGRHAFQKLAQNLGLPASEIHAVRSRHDIYNVLNDSDGKKFLLSSPNGTSGPTTQAILPRRTVSQTYSDVAQLHPSKSSPWTLEEYVEGTSHFTGCGIVARGELKVFVATTLSDDGYCKRVSALSGISDAMKQYMKNFASAMGPDLSSHLTMEFRVVEKATQAGVVQQICPLDGKLIPHESLLLIDGKQGPFELSKAYLEVLATKPLGSEVTSSTVTSSECAFGVYSIHHDLGHVVLGPLLQLIILRKSVLDVARAWVTHLHHLVSWQETLYDFGDPLPLFWYTYVARPCELISDIWQEARSRLRLLHKRSTQKRIYRKPKQNGR